MRRCHLTTVCRQAVVDLPGAAATVHPVTAAELGASWRPGCPLEPGRLGRVEIDHIGFDGRTHRGELVVHEDLVAEVIALFEHLHELRYPIEKIRTVDHYPDAAAELSMEDNNTSAFNCARIPGTGGWSQHAYGRAIDLNPRLNPYIGRTDALLSARDPRSVTVWLGKSPAARMLSDLSRSGQPITHEALDLLSPSRPADYIREILVRTAILEPRNEYLERLGPWVDHYLTDVPDHQARILKAYAHWYLLHRARRRKAPLVRSAGHRIHTRVRVAHEFLTWVEAQGHTLVTVPQDLVDNWLANGTTRHHEIRQFLHWASQRGLTTGVSAPALKPTQPTAFISEEDSSNSCTDASPTKPSPLNFVPAGR
ncbi:MAG: hypothetical protein JWR37_3552 [Mycobacterium sp.]|nr:hypothetical protein [Mycobacterium sp.]